MRLNNPCQASDFGTCRDNCLDASGCLTFGYSSNGTCVMYSTSLPRMGYQQKNVEHGGRFYNRGCFERNCCSQTLDTPDNCTGTQWETQWRPRANASWAAALSGSAADIWILGMCVDKDGDRNNCGACGNAVSLFFRGEAYHSGRHAD